MHRTLLACLAALIVCAVPATARTVSATVGIIRESKFRGFTGIPVMVFSVSDWEAYQKSWREKNGWDDEKKQAELKAQPFDENRFTTRPLSLDRLYAQWLFDTMTDLPTPVASGRTDRMGTFSVEIPDGEYWILVRTEDGGPFQWLLQSSELSETPRRFIMRDTMAYRIIRRVDRAAGVVSW